MNPTQRTLSFFAAGVPVTQGSKRIVRGGRMIEAAKGHRAWRRAVARAAWIQIATAARRADYPLTGPVCARLEFVCLRPRKPARPYPRSDIDKLQRAVFDSLVTAGALRDDSQVVDVQATKHYAQAGDRCGCWVLLSAQGEAT